jgi:uracil phosphoribosyltransferase
MLGTGGSAKCAINVLIEAGADVKRIIFVNVISCPEGIESLHNAYPGE